MGRRVVFEEFGGIDRLHIVEAPDPQPGLGQVRVRVAFAGLNPVDWKILAGGPGRGAPKPPSGNGNDFAGVVDMVGPGVEDLAVGDPVFGGLRFFAQADHLLIDAAHVCAVPPGLGLDTAAGLQITSLTALAGVRAIAPRAGETVLVTGAAGGVGVLAAQLARAAGATVLGTAGPDNHPFLQSLGIVPVLYGEGLADRLRDLAPGGIQAAYSTRGLDEVRALVGLGIPAGRINAIAAGPAAGELGAHTDGMAASLPGDLERIAAAVASGALISPIDSVYDLEDVGSAYARLQAGHVRGKILLRTASAAGAAELLGA